MKEKGSETRRALSAVGVFLLLGALMLIATRFIH
jgi:hypothetical protein